MTPRMAPLTARGQPSKPNERTRLGGRGLGTERVEIPKPLAISV